MPTTRYGRFRLYSARARRRLRLANQRFRLPHGTSGGDHRKTSRRLSTLGASKQVPKSYPRHPHGDGMTAADWLLHGWTPPRYRQCGWLGDGFHVEPPLGSRTHPREPVIGYHARRVKWIPRLGQLHVNPYFMAKSDLTPGDAYRAEFYPSGRRSYASSQGWV